MAIPVWAALAGAGALKGALDANAAKKNQKEHDSYRKAAIQYSPWTGMTDPGAGNFGNQNMLSGALGGGLKGALYGKMIGGSIGSLGGAGAGGAGGGIGGATSANPGPYTMMM